MDSKQEEGKFKEKKVDELTLHAVAPRINRERYSEKSGQKTLTGQALRHEKGKYVSREENAEMQRLTFT